MKVGLCLPRQCENDELQRLFNQTVNRYYWKIQKEINSQINDNLWSRLQSSNNVHLKVSLVILVTLLSTVLISTLFDLNFKFNKQNSILYNLIESASIKSNYNKLHSNDAGHKNDFISKNRYYSEMMVNVTHFIVFVPLLGGSVVNERIFDWLELSNKSYLQFILTDCYYPGLIVLASTTVSLKMYSFIEKQASGRELIENAIKRMISFWPILIVLISIQIAMPFFVRGPLINELIRPLAQRCEKHWMLNLLFINNLLPLQDTCLPYTWTISCELQLYIIATFLTFLYIKNPKQALRLNVLLILVGFCSNVYVSYNGLTKPNVVFFPFDYQSMRDSIYYSHSNTLIQLSPYFTIFLAFYLRLTRKSFKMSIVSCDPLVFI